MFDFGIKDFIDIVLVAFLLYYIYRLMKESGTLNIFYGVMAFVAVWMVTSEIFNMRLIGSFMSKFMSIGLLILVILFQDQIKRFLVDLGNHRHWRFVRKLFRHNHQNEGKDVHALVMPIVYACMSMSKTKTGALIVIARTMPLESYEKTGDIIDARINQRLIENIFFKNTPLHDGAMIIDKGRISSAGCILPVSHDNNIPRSLGLRHRSGLGIAQSTDAMAIIVSEETGRISVASHGSLNVGISTSELENYVSEALSSPQD